MGKFGLPARLTQIRNLQAVLELRFATQLSFVQSNLGHRRCGNDSSERGVQSVALAYAVGGESLRDTCRYLAVWGMDVTKRVSRSWQDPYVELPERTSLATAFYRNLAQGLC